MLSRSIDNRMVFARHDFVTDLKPDVAQCPIAGRIQLPADAGPFGKNPVGLPVDSVAFMPWKVSISPGKDSWSIIAHEFDPGKKRGLDSHSIT